jgi:hypothetical protein
VFVSPLTPPALAANAFESVPKEVRFGCLWESLTRYRLDENWAPYFPMIENLPNDGHLVESMTGESKEIYRPWPQDTSSDKGSGKTGNLLVSPLPAGTVAVYDLGGREVYRGEQAAMPSLPSGLYIVSSSTGVHKVKL